MGTGWLTCIPAVLLPHSPCRFTTANAPANRQMPIASVVSSNYKKQKKTRQKHVYYIEKRIIERMRYRFNFKAIIVGVLALVAFFFSATMSFKDMNIRNKGQILKAPITEIYTRRWMSWIKVEINGQQLDAGSVTTEKQPKIGDFVEVSYLAGEYNVVQTSLNPKRYYLFFFLESLLFIFGGYLTIAGFLGKGKENEKTRDQKSFIKISKKERRKKKIVN